MGEIPKLDIHKFAVTHILMACQNYMREKKVAILKSLGVRDLRMVIFQDECSFVSLRDVERAMIVLKWFHSVLDHIEKDALYKDTVCNSLAMTYMKFPFCTEM